jgi:LysR family transcriptional regulator for metE and metH
MDLEVRHLRLVAAVAEHQTLTKAGDALHLTQSALSHQLRDIEDRLGAQLFQRLNRRMKPTPAGERLLASAQTVLKELTATEEAIRSGLAPAPVELRMATECYTCYHWLPGVLKPYRRRFPHVQVRIDPTATNNPVGRVLDGQLDVAIVSSAVRNPRLSVVPLFEDEHVLITAPDHPLADRPFVKLTDFRTLRLLTYAPKDDNHFITRVLQPAGVLPAAVEPVQLTEAAIEMVRAGLGVAVLAGWAVDPFVRRGTIRAVRITPRGYFKEWRAVMLRHLAGAEHVREFLHLVAESAPSGNARAVAPRQRRAVARSRT